jgi:hypothetical protein
MAADQRYCLACGERRGGPRVPFPPAGAAEPATAEAAPGPPAAPGSSGARAAAPLWIAAVGVLVLAMGVGVLIGRAGGGEAAPVRTAPPITVTVPGAGVPAATPEPAAEAPASPKSKKPAKRAEPAAAPETTAGKQELQQLDDLSPEDYQKKSKALPQTVGTQGAPPPKDDKPAGGGGGFEEIG